MYMLMMDHDATQGGGSAAASTPGSNSYYDVVWSVCWACLTHLAGQCYQGPMPSSAAPVEPAAAGPPPAPPVRTAGLNRIRQDGAASRV